MVEIFGQHTCPVSMLINHVTSIVFMTSLVRHEKSQDSFINVA
jgi:hypothetical protein